MTKVVFVVALLGLLVAYSAGVSQTTYPTINPANFKKLFESYRPFSDLNTAFYASKGSRLVNDKLTNEEELCAFVKSKLDSNNLESIYYSVGLVSLINNCQLNVADFQKTISSASTSKSMLDLYYFTEISTLLKQKFDSSALTKSVLNALKEDNSILNQGLSLHVASLLEGDIQTFYNNLEDLLEQADEIDGKYLQYEGGVATTSIVLEGILRLGDKFSKLPAKYNSNVFEKFINYIINKRHVTNAKSAYHLLSVAVRFVDNKFAVPVIINRISSIGLTNESPNVVVSVQNILGAPFKNYEFTIDAQSNLFSGKKTLTKRSSDGSVNELKVIDTNTQQSNGFYSLTLTVTPKPTDKRLLILNTKVEVKILTQIEINDLQVGAADRDQSNPKFNRIENGKKVKLDADQSSKVYVKFSVNDKTKKAPIEINQAFVRFVEVKSGREIIFIAEQTASKDYLCVVDLSAHAKSFGRLDGIFNIELIASDPLVSNPQTIQVGEIKLQFVDGTSSIIDAKDTLYKAKPEIKHLFRQPDPRPPVIVSTVFSALCLLPLLLLVVLWFNTGLNFSNFKFSLSGLVFHFTLASVFGLFYCYWLYLDMFTALKYLSLLSIILFVSGKRLLSGLASNKEKTA